jgi:type IV pilus assembly protein PilO
MERTDRQRLILLTLLIGMVGWAGYYGVAGFAGVKGLQEQARKLEKERNELRVQVDNATAMVANLDRIKKERQALEAQLSEVSRRLPGEHESAQVLRSVETLAGKSGLTVTAVKRRPNRPQELYVEIPMEVGVGGGYYDLLKFTDQLSQLPRLVTLNELRVLARGPGAPTGAAGRIAGAAASADAPGTMNAQMVAVVFQAMAGPSPAGATPPANAAAKQ